MLLPKASRRPVRVPGRRGSGQTPAGAGRHDVVSARRVTLEGGAEDAAVYGIQHGEDERTSPQVLPRLPAPRVCRKASGTARPRPGHTGSCPRSSPSLPPAQVAFAARAWPPAPREGPLGPARLTHRQPWGFQPLGPARCQLTEENSSARLLNFHPPSHKSFCGYGQENPCRPFTELGSGLAWPGRILLDAQ